MDPDSSEEASGPVGCKEMIRVVLLVCLMAMVSAWVPSSPIKARFGQVSNGR